MEGVHIVAVSYHNIGPLVSSRENSINPHHDEREGPILRGKYIAHAQGIAAKRRVLAIKPYFHRYTPFPRRLSPDGALLCDRGRICFA